MKAQTPEKLRLDALRREKEIAKWEREKARPKRDTYLVSLIFVLTLIYATDEIASGTDPKTVADTLGHSTVAMTMDIYAAVSMDAKRAAAQRRQAEYAKES